MLLIRYGEIGLKGKNRPMFEKKLVYNIRNGLRRAGFKDFRVERKRGRILLSMSSVLDEEKAEAELRKVFGIVAISRVRQANSDIFDIQEVALGLLKGRQAGTFKVETRRTDKRFPLISPEVSRLVGGYVLENTDNLSVDVHHPDVVVDVEIRQEGVYVYTDSIRGIGGLPVGVNGKVHLLLSGGIDSPVAYWMSLKRGVEVEPIHFDSHPFTSERSREKVIDICKVLAGYTPESVALQLVYFTEIHKAIVLDVHADLGVTVMRRMMFRISEQIAKQRNGLALVTGESLGQVASQTLESMAVINDVVRLPVLRPLVGFDKEEIVLRSQNIGTYDISIRPYDDCCSLVVSSSPKTRPNLEQVLKAEEKLDVDGLVAEAIEKTQVIMVDRKGIESD